LVLQQEHTNRRLTLHLHVVTTTTPAKFSDALWSPK